MATAASVAAILLTVAGGIWIISRGSAFVEAGIAANASDIAVHSIMLDGLGMQMHSLITNNAVTRQQINGLGEKVDLIIEILNRP